MSAQASFAGYPSAVIYSDSKFKTPVHELLWGDFVDVQSVQGNVATLKSKVDGTRFMKVSELQQNRLLEVVFVDIGQGDGALLVTPDDRAIVIDAGESDNMVRFLRWRYRHFDKKFAFEAAVISHSDMDHYGGFDPLFDEKNVTVKTLFHNGLVERSGKDTLGKVEDGLCTELVRDKKALDALLKVPANSKGKKYPTLLKKGLAGVVKDVRSLNVEDGFMPGFGAAEKVSIEVLGPVPETKNGKTGLRWLGKLGPTKNGHSVVLKLRYGNLTLLLGGDLNIPSENILLAHHTGLDAPAKSAEEQQLLIEAARKKFQCDVAKACHHGSADVSLDFLSAVNPIATVISSGDDEPHAHPRADALGAIGATSRGPRPLIFSTELARSAKETIKHPNALKAELAAMRKAITEEKDAKKKEKLEASYDKLLNESLNRSVAVYGAINLRSDGVRTLLGYRVENPKPDRKWDLYELRPDASGKLRYQSKYD